MILQALKNYYDRKALDPDSALAPEGWIARGLDYVFVLEADGKLVNVECLQTNAGKKKTPKTEFVPYIGKQALKHTNSGKDANLLWDNSAFVLGIGKKGDIKIASFFKMVKEWFSEIHDEGISAVLAFVEAGIKNRTHFQPILQYPGFGEELSSGSPTVTFRLAQDATYIFLRSQVKKAYENKIANQSSNDKGVCLVSGEMDVAIERTHTSIKGLYGQKKIGPLVSFNVPSSWSHGKDDQQSKNAPVGKVATTSYVKALNRLLESKQRLQVGNSTTVFWAEKQDELENIFADIFSEPPKDGPDRNTRAVESLYRSVQTGGFVTDNDTTRFFVLGLAPNAARISIRFWQVGTVAELAGRIRRHFDDLAIAHADYDKPHLSLFRLLKNIAVLGKAENIPPNLAGDTMRAILAGLPYPATLLQAVVRRIRAEHEINHPRAALIKACLNRSIRFYKLNEKEIAVSLDKNNPNIGYRLGRLFAVLERIQKRANPTLKATIRDRYYGAASNTPVTVFPILLRLKNHHLSKLEYKCEVISMENHIGEIMNKGLDGEQGFPPTLTLADQGRFAIGYYHQRNEFFTSPTKQNEGE